MAVILLGSAWGMAGEKSPHVSEFPVFTQQAVPWNLPGKMPDAGGKIKAAVDLLTPKRGAAVWVSPRFRMKGG